MKCSHPETKYAIVNGNRTSIHDYKGTIPYCEKGHELVGVQGKHNQWHFRHKNPNDVSGELSEWHREWQRHFDSIEVCFEKMEGQIKARRADIVEGYNVVEIQHSALSKEEVENRNKDYELNQKKVLWVIDGTSMSVHGNVLTIDKIWKYDSFLSCEFIFINVGEYVYKVIPQAIKSLTVHVIPIHKSVFIESIKSNTVHAWEVPCQSKLYLKQQGAGNGKTWGIIQMLGRPDFTHYKHFIYVTKQHSARVIIKEEFRHQQTTLGFSEVGEIKESNKKFLIRYKNSIEKDCSIIISTIDSFMYAVGNKDVKSFDKFQGIARSIVEGHLEADARGTIKYATINPKLNAETLYIIDEAQDLNSCYAYAVLAVMGKTNMDVYVVGDKLQSISNEINAFAVFQDSPLAILEEPVNICRRFIEPELVAFVNHMTPFSKYNLQEVSPYKNVTEPSSSKRLFPILVKKKDDKNYIEDTVDKIMFEYKKQVEENGYMPENFLVVVPFISNNPLSGILDVALNHFWSKKLTKEFTSTLTDDYWKTHDHDEYYRYSIIHKSEEGSSINLDESARATRIVSIHASKGDGREVVFVVGLNDFYLKCCSGIKESLIYDSLLHVAFTRMKETMYVFYGDDEIGRRIKEWCLIRGEAFEIDNVVIKNRISVKDILRLKGEALNKLNDLEYVDSNDSSELIDMSHHNIRYGILIEKIADLLKREKFDKRHLAVQQSVVCKTSVMKCYNWKDYNQRVRINKDFDTSNKDKCIPLLYTNSYYNEYNTMIIKIIEKIKYKINMNLPLCPLELIVFYYMKRVIQPCFESPITIIELYNIFHVYQKSYQHHLRSHETCLCNVLFVDNPNSNSLTDYLVSHYERMMKIDTLIETIVENHTCSWNPDHFIRYGDKRFCLHSCCDFIGYNETDVVVLYVKPVLNSLNFNELKSKAILDTFILKNQTENKINGEPNENFEKYKNKKINIYIVSTNLTEPYLFQIEEVDPRSVISEAIYEKYKIYNNELYYFYLQYRKKMEYKTFLIEWERIKTETKSECPSYVDDFITAMNRDSKRGRISDLDSIFVSELNMVLKETIDDFLGISI